MRHRVGYMYLACAMPITITSPLTTPLTLMMQYPRPLQTPEPGSYVPRALAELRDPTTPRKTPIFPSYLASATPRTLAPRWNVITHAIPSAFPRANISTIPRLAHKDKLILEEASITKQEKKARAAAIVKHIQECRDSLDFKNESKGPSEEQLWNVINRYHPSDARRPEGCTAITLIATHAGGFHKEVSLNLCKHNIY